MINIGMFDTLTYDDGINEGKVYPRTTLDRILVDVNTETTLESKIGKITSGYIRSGSTSNITTNDPITIEGYNNNIRSTYHKNAVIEGCNHIIDGCPSTYNFLADDFVNTICDIVHIEGMSNEEYVSNKTLHMEGIGNYIFKNMYHAHIEGGFNKKYISSLNISEVRTILNNLDHKYYNYARTISYTRLYDDIYLDNNPHNTYHVEGFLNKEIQSFSRYPESYSMHVGTSNLNSYGVLLNSNTGYSDSEDWIQVLSLPDCVSMIIEIWYHTESSYDYGCVWAGDHSDYTAVNNYSSSITGKISGGSGTSFEKNIKRYQIFDNTVTVGWHSDSSVHDYYGFFVMIYPGDISKDNHIEGSFNNLLSFSFQASTLGNCAHGGFSYTHIEGYNNKIYGVDVDVYALTVSGNNNKIRFNRRNSTYYYQGLSVYGNNLDLDKTDDEVLFRYGEHFTILRNGLDIRYTFPNDNEYSYGNVSSSETRGLRIFSKIRHSSGRYKHITNSHYNAPVMLLGDPFEIEKRWTKDYGGYVLENSNENNYAPALIIKSPFDHYMTGFTMANGDSSYGLWMPGFKEIDTNMLNAHAETGGYNSSDGSLYADYLIHKNKVDGVVYSAAKFLYLIKENQLYDIENGFIWLSV